MSDDVEKPDEDEPEPEKPDGGDPPEEEPEARLDTRTLRRMKLVLSAISALTLLIVLAFASITRIDASHVGILVKLTGEDKIRGVQDVPIVTGWTIFNPITRQVIEFPISVQNVVWTASVDEGKPVDESITFSSVEGVSVNADIGLGFHIDPAKAPHLFLRFYETDLRVIADGFVRNSIRESFNTVASRMTIIDIYGGGKAELVKRVTEDVSSKLRDDGFIIDQVTINGALRLPANVADAINKAIAVKEDAIREENRIRQVKAEAEQEKEKAAGKAEAARIEADGKADAILKVAEANARAYALLKGITPEILQKEAIGKWDGKLPTVTSGAVPFVNIPKAK